MSTLSSAASTVSAAVSEKISAVIDAIHAKWESVHSASPVFANGYAHLYSPVVESPELMIIGLNPGAEAAAIPFDAATARAVPTSHTYITGKHMLAEKMTKLFESNDQLEMLASSVKLNLFFFRSSSIGEWHSVDPVLRTELEAFFEEQAREIINTLKPKKIVCEGLETLERVKTMFGSSHKSFDTKSQGRTVYRTSTVTLADESKVQVIGIMHPAARVSFTDFDVMADALKEDLSHTVA